VEIDAETDQVEVGYIEELLREERIESAIRDLGYEVE